MCEGGFMMKKLIILLALPAVLYCNGKPKIQFDSFTHAFGKQDRSVELKHIFTFKNIGGSVLKINKIEAG
jgi:hypothetical protein